MTGRLVNLVIALSLILLLSGFSGPTPPYTPPPLGPEAALTTAGPDEYGYTLTDEVAYAFEDIAEWSSTGSLNAGRQDHTATLLQDGKVLVAGGYVGDYLASSELYDPSTGIWTTTGSLNLARQDHTATLLQDGRVLVAGGYDGGYVSVSEIYDPTSGTWETTDDSLTTARRYHTATLLADGRVLVTGGDNGSYLNSVELFDPTGSGVWTEIAAMDLARQNHTATLLSTGKVLVAGGYIDGPGDEYEELFDPATSEWESTGTLLSLRQDHTASLLANGRVIIAGGYAGGYLASAEVYSPSTGLFEYTGSLNESRQYHQATLLADGRILVTGGVNGEGVLSSAEVYEYSSGEWFTTYPMNTARQGHAAVRLSDGNVLVMGGNDGSGYLTDSELYNPGITIDFTDLNNGTSSIPIQPFDFYDSTNLPSAYVSVNGFAAFGTAPPTRLTGVNKSFPTDSSPNLVVAPFWYDLSIESYGRIYRRDYPDPDPDPRTVIQWTNVSARTYGSVTFQVVLHQNGNIDFAYRPKAGGSFANVTAGIEDVDGVTGLNYGIPDLSMGKRVEFTYPPPGAYVKSRPQVSSDMFTNGVAWHVVKITNISTDAQPDDSYDLVAVLEAEYPAGFGFWSVTFYDPTCTTSITTLDNLVKNDDTNLCVRVAAGGELTPGYYSRHKVTLTSRNDSTHSTGFYLQTAVSAPFAQIYQDDPPASSSSFYFDRMLPSESFSQLLSYPYNGSFMSMSMLAPGHYIVTWHEGAQIRYRLYHQSSGLLTATRQIAASPIEADDPVDLTPAVAYSRNGRIGILYLFNKYRTPTPPDDPPCTARVVNSNIYLTVLDANGVITTPEPFNITQKDKYVCLNGGTADYPQYWYPRIVPAGQDSFGLVWQEHYAGNDFDQIGYAVYRTDGIVYFYNVIAGASDINKHISPAAAGLVDGRFVIGFVNYTGPNDPYQLTYSVINTSGDAVIDKRIIAGTNSKEIDITQLPDGKLIFTWTNLTSGTIAYAIQAANLLNVATAATDLIYNDYPGHSNYRSMGGSSVTWNSAGNAIVTWQDADWQEQLYYALIGPNGSPVTPPMLYKRVGSTYPESQFSTSGSSNAPYLDLSQFFLPLIKR